MKITISILLISFLGFCLASTTYTIIADRDGATHNLVKYVPGDPCPNQCDFDSTHTTMNVTFYSPVLYFQEIWTADASFPLTSIPSGCSVTSASVTFTDSSTTIPNPFNGQTLNIIQETTAWTESLMCQPVPYVTYSCGVSANINPISLAGTCSINTSGACTLSSVGPRVTSALSSGRIVFAAQRSNVGNQYLLSRRSSGTGKPKLVVTCA